MKTKLTHIVFSKETLAVLYICMILSTRVSAQEDNSIGPITLTYKNFVVPVKAKYVYQGADPSGVAIPSKGANQCWDYSGLKKNDANTNVISYVPAHHQNAFPGALRQFDNFFNLGAIPIAQTNMEGNNENSYHGLGTHFERQAFSLSQITGNAGDSLIIEKQNVQEPNQIFQKYPVTYHTSFKSHSISVTNFILTIAAFGLDHAPGQFVQHTFDSRKVTGWGKVRIPTDSGPSRYIKALLERLSVLKIDSVYLNGEPAPPELLAAFGVTQGETTHSFYQYRLYRKGIDAYLINFFMDSTFNTITGLNYDTKYVDKNEDSDLFAEGKHTNDDLATDNMTVKIFPNPSSNEFAINWNSKDASHASIMVFDLSGKQVQKFENVSSAFRFGKELSPGTYLVQVILNNEKRTFKLVKSE